MGTAGQAHYRGGTSESQALPWENCASFFGAQRGGRVPEVVDAHRGQGGKALGDLFAQDSLAGQQIAGLQDVPELLQTELGQVHVVMACHGSPKMTVTSGLSPLSDLAGRCFVVVKYPPLSAVPVVAFTASIDERD